MIAISPTELQERLQALCPRPLKVVILKGKSTYALARIDGKELILSVHPLFLYSTTPVLEALIRFALKSDPKSRAVIRQMANLYFTRIAPPVPDQTLSKPQGVFFDLQVIYDRVNHNYFDGKIVVPISWFPAPRYRRFRHITFGTYDRTQPLVRINKLLDHESVPEYFIEFIVYHEMLHAVCEPHLDGRGRQCVHTAEFRRREKLHPDYEKAKVWAKECLKLLKKRAYGRA